MNITVNIPDEKVADYLERANSSAWAKIVDYPPPTQIVTGDKVAILDEYGDEEKVIKRHKLGLKKVKRGLAVLANKLPHHFRDIIEDAGDQYTGDYLIQCALFGEVKYD